MFDIRYYIVSNESPSGSEFLTLTEVCLRRVPEGYALGSCVSLQGASFLRSSVRGEGERLSCVAAAHVA